METWLCSCHVIVFGHCCLSQYRFSRLSAVLYYNMELSKFLFIDNNSSKYKNVPHAIETSTKHVILSCTHQIQDLIAPAKITFHHPILRTKMGETQACFLFKTIGLSDFVYVSHRVIFLTLKTLSARTVSFLGYSIQDTRYCYDY